MYILAIDPGAEQSAYCVWDSKEQKIVDKGIENNKVLLQKIHNLSTFPDYFFVVETTQCFGMPVGKEVFETIWWEGRFCQVWSEGWGKEFMRIYRKDIKLHFCNSLRAKDANIRQALVDRFGKPGTKKSPGTLYGVKKDIWSAVALAVYAADKRR